MRWLRRPVRTGAAIAVHCGAVPAGSIAVINSATFSRALHPSSFIWAIKSLRRRSQ
jgi:hypothetical protein